MTLSPWIWMRLTRHWSEKLMDWWLLLFNLMFNLRMLSFKSGNYVGVYYFLGFLDVVCHTKYWRSHVFHTFLGLALYKYNASFYDLGIVSFELRIPTAEVLPWFSEAVLLPQILMFWFIVIPGTQMMFMEYRKETDKATNTAKLCIVVSECLLQYDTEKAWRYIDEATGVNEDTASALMQMVKNVELYRPHIPEYVWGMVKKWKKSSATPPDTSSVSSKGSNNVVAPPVPPSPVSPQPSEPSHQLSSSMLSYFGPESAQGISWCCVDFRRKRLAQDFHDGAFTDDGIKPSAVRILVNWCHKAVVNSRGTLHTFIGDTIHATWCFQNPSHKPPIFLAQLYSTFTDKLDSGLFVSGCVATGPGTSYMAGDRRQAYILHVPWRDKVDILHKLARENIAALVDEQTLRSCRNHVTCRWVESMTNPSLGDSSPLRVYEIVNEVIDVTRDHKIKRLGSMSSRSSSVSMNEVERSNNDDDQNNNNNFDNVAHMGSDEEDEAPPSSYHAVDVDEEGSAPQQPSEHVIHSGVVLKDVVSKAMNRFTKNDFEGALKILFDDPFVTHGTHSRMVFRLQAKIQQQQTMTK
eukprot:PhF_6_TR37891/c0_g1_i2/m.56560